MDKAKAMERLDAIEAEAKELRKIIEEKPIAYDEDMVYVAKEHGCPYILVGLDEANYYRWHSFDEYRTETGWGRPLETGQAAIDKAILNGFDIREFSDTREAFKYFLDNYKG